MKYTIANDRVVPAPRKLAWAVVGLGCALAGSAALAWQNGSNKPRGALIEEAEITLPTKSEPPPKPVTKPAAKPATKPVVQQPIEEEEIFTEPEETQPAPRPRIAAPATAKPATRTTPRPSLQSRQPSTQRSYLPFPLPSFSKSTPEARPSESSASTGGSRRVPTAGNKAVGRVGRPSSSRSKPAEQPVEQNSNITQTPRPAQREPRVAERPATKARIVEAPIIDAPDATPVTRPAPKTVASAAKPTPVAPAKPAAPTKPIPALPKPATTSESTLPLVNSLPRKLAPLEFRKHTDVRPAGFQEVTPGQTKISGIAQHLGEPVDTERDGDTTIMTYQVGPFPKVEVILAGDVVDSVVIHLKEAVSAKDVINELGLDTFQAVDVRDDQGELLGKAVPERGVALSYDPDSDGQKVGQVVLAAVTTEPFLIRALENPHRFQQTLADAAYVASIDSELSDTAAARARILHSLGRLAEARTAIEAALRIDAGASENRLLYARIMGEAGDYKNALKMAESVATSAGVPEECAAQAELLWGDLLSHSDDRDYPAAVEHHTKAIKLASALVEDEDPVIRKAAIQVLIDANLAVARDVALGNYKRKSEVVPKWIAKAQAAKEMATDQGDADYLELHLAAGTLAAHGCLQEPLDPTPFVEVAMAKGQDLIAASDDPLFKQHLEWKLGCALLDAVQIEHARGEFDVATQYANNALALLRDNAANREATPHRDFIMGRMFFAMGALYAVGKDDHAEAVHYYLQAIPLLDKPSPSDLADDQGRHGERFISIGVSFWQNGNKNQAVELTLKGSELLHRAIDEGEIDKSALAVPYSNLAAMYKSLGNTTEAKKYGDLARVLEEPKSRR